jgi:hypothetical protein
MFLGRVSMSVVLIGSVLTIAGCTPPTSTASAPVAAPDAVLAPAPFVAGEGEPQIWNPLDADDPNMAAFGVVKFNDLPNLSQISTVRMFGIGSGDPAMNGLKVYLAFVSTHDDRAFLLGNFRDYRVIASSPGRIDLEYDEDIMVGDEPQLRTMRAIVSWTEKAQEPSPNPEYPATVTMTPAK